MKSIKKLYPMFLKYFELFLLYFRLFWVILTYFGIFWHILWVSCENTANLILITTIFLKIIFIFSKTIKSNLLQLGPFTLLISVGNCMFKTNNGNTKTRCELCSELTKNTPEPLYWHRSGVFIVNFEHNLHLVLVLLLLSLSR